MARDIFEELAEWQVPPPPPPERLEQVVHERVNKQLVILHLVDLLLRGMPWAMWHFCRAMIGAVGLSLTGKWAAPPRDEGPPGQKQL